MRKDGPRWWEYEIAGIITEPGSTVRCKTGTWRSVKPVLDRQKCTGCKRCWLFCPEGCIRFPNGKESISIDYDYCKGCGICAAECRLKAINLVSENLS